MDGAEHTMTALHYIINLLSLIVVYISRCFQFVLLTPGKLNNKLSIKLVQNLAKILRNPFDAWQIFQGNI